MLYRFWITNQPRLYFFNRNANQFFINWGITKFPFQFQLQSIIIVSVKIVN